MFFLRILFFPLFLNGSFEASLKRYHFRKSIISKLNLLLFFFLLFFLINLVFFSGSAHINFLEQHSSIIFCLLFAEMIIFDVHFFHCIFDFNVWVCYLGICVQLCPVQVFVQLLSEFLSLDSKI